MSVKRRFADIDLSRLPILPGPPEYDAIYAERMAEAARRLNAEGIPYDVGSSVRGDTVPILEGAGGYREAGVYRALYDVRDSLLLAKAQGAALDHFGAGFEPPVARNPLVASPRSFDTNPEDWEADDDFRSRIQLAPEALSTCGPGGAYLFFALETDGVKAAAAYGPMSFGGTFDATFTPPGVVRIPVVALADDPFVHPAAGRGDVPAGRRNGAASPELLAAVAAEVNSDERIPLADFVQPSAAVIVPYRIEAVLYVGAGADRALVRSEAIRRLLAQARQQHAPGAMQARRMLYGQCFVTDAAGANVVGDVDLIEPAADVNAEPIGPATPGAAYRAPYCTDIFVRVEVADDGS